MLVQNSNPMAINAYKQNETSADEKVQKAKKNLWNKPFKTLLMK